MDLTVFVAVTAAAVVLQAIVLLAMLFALRKTSARMEALAEDVRAKVLPVAETAHTMLTELRPKIENTVANLSETTTLVRAELERLDATVNDAIDRARLQVIRADDLVTRTIDKVEETTDIVHRAVVSPVRRVTGLLQGIGVGLETLVGSRRRRRDGVTVPQDEMFI
jgi:methyl-accepting chemotaxis protein